MNLAEQLIDEFVTEKLVAGKVLSGAEVQNLKSKQHVFINGKRAVVFDSVRRGNDVELTYMTGTKLLGPEKYLVVSATASSTPVSAADEVNEGYKITRGMKKAYERISSALGVKQCPDCDSIIPRYPGRYPSKCPYCGGTLEDLQNSPKYSEGKQRRTTAEFNKVNAQVRRVPKDRIGNE